MRRHVRTTGLVIAGVAIGAIAAAWLLGDSSPEEPLAPPLPSPELTTDAAVRKLVESSLDRVRTAPANAENWFTLGRVYHANAAYAPAALAYEQALTIDSASPKCWFLLAITRDELGETSAATEAMRTAAELAPHYAPTHWRLGDLLMREGELDEAEHAFRRAAQVDSRNSGGDVGLARLALSRGRPEEAAAILEPRFRQQDDPNLGYVAHLLAQAHRRMGRVEDAEMLMRRFFGREPVWQDPWMAELEALRVSFAARLERATSLIAQRRVQQAIGHFEALRAERPKHAATLTGLAAALIAAGRADEAAQILSELVSREPTSYKAHANLGLALLMQSQQSAAAAADRLRDRAAQHLDRAIELDPSLAQAHFVRSLIHEQDDEWGHARESLRRATALEPGNADWTMRLARVHAQLGEWHGAIVVLEPLVRWSPEVQDGFLLLGQAYLRTGDWEKATVALERAHRASPGDARVTAAMLELERRPAATPVRP